MVESHQFVYIYTIVIGNYGIGNDEIINLFVFMRTWETIILEWQNPIHRFDGSAAAHRNCLFSQNIDSISYLNLKLLQCHSNLHLPIDWQVPGWLNQENVTFPSFWMDAVSIWVIHVWPNISNFIILFFVNEAKFRFICLWILRGRLLYLNPSKSKFKKTARTQLFIAVSRLWRNVKCIPFVLIWFAV